MKCTNCGNEIFEGELFCQECGCGVGKQEALADRFCGCCGARLSAGEAFCGHCGTSINGVNSTLNANYEKSISSKKSPVRLIIIIILLIILVALSCVAGYILFSDSENAAKDDISDAKKVSETIRPKKGEKSDKETETPYPSEAAEENLEQTGDYLFNSDMEYITEEYLDTKNQEQVRLILNEMYAKHGYIFSVEKYRLYFSGKSWYVPVYTSAEEAESYFNNIEKQNKITIVNYESSKGWR